MILAASAMVRTGLYAFVAEAGEVVSVVIAERYHPVAVPGTERTGILRGCSAFADRLGEQGSQG